MYSYAGVTSNLMFGFHSLASAAAGMTTRAVTGALICGRKVLCLGANDYDCCIIVCTHLSIVRNTITHSAKVHDGAHQGQLGDGHLSSHVTGIAPVQQPLSTQAARGIC
jgi:hypothetical protein